MGAIQDTYQLTVHRLTPDGLGGFWWSTRDSNDNAYQIEYTNAIVESAARMVHVDTFAQLLIAFSANNITLPQVELNINVDQVADREGLQAQFETPLLTNVQIDQIPNFFDPAELCKLFGVWALVRRFFIRGHLTLQQLREILLYLGVEGKIGRPKAEQTIDYLLNNNNPQTNQPWITQVQADAFWIDWDIQVES